MKTKLGSPEFLKDLAIELREQKEIRLSLDGPSAFALIGMIQLVLRHPRLPLNVRDQAELIERTLSQRLGLTDTIRRAIAAGNDVTQDERAEN